MKMDIFTIGWFVGTGLSLLPVDNSNSQASDTLPISPTTYKTAKKIEVLKAKEETLNQKIENLTSGFDSTKTELKEAIKSTDKIIVTQGQTLNNVRAAKSIVAKLIAPKPTKQTVLYLRPLPAITYTIPAPDTTHIPDREVVVPCPDREPFFKRLNIFRRHK